MADRPILFSGPMVRAILDGRKTQTRRVLKPQPRDGARYNGVHFASDEPGSWFFNTPHGGQKVRVAYEEGDLLWVRERATRFDKGTCDQHIWFAAGRNEIYPWLGKNFPGLDPNAPWPHPEGPGGGAPYSIPSIHMPRWASRLTLIVTDVRVQRLQEISEAGAIAEGCIPDDGSPNPNHIGPARSIFAGLWDGLNAKRGYGWEVNPWVVALTFSVHQRNIDAMEADHAS